MGSPKGGNTDNGASSYRRYLDGDESAFDEIMRELFDPLVAFVAQYTRDYHAAEDIAIDVFSDLIVYRHRYNFKVTLKTYLFMVGRSKALNYIRHRTSRRETEWETEDGVSVGAFLPADERTPEEHLLADEKGNRVREAVMALPQEMRDAVYLVFFEGLTYEETAKVLKKNCKQIDNLLFRAKKLLRETLSEEYV